MNPDFEDLLRGLSASRAEYLVIGGYAVAFHSEPRYTKNLDVWVRPTAANAGQRSGARADCFTSFDVAIGPAAE